MVKNCKTHLKPISLLLLAILLVRINAQTGTCTACVSNCNACTSSACTTPATGYYLTSVAAATPAACATGCSACTSASVCTTAASGYFLSSGTPSACAGTGCSVCTSASAGACTTAASGYYLNSGAPSACATGCSVCTSSSACTTAATGYYLSSGTPMACATGCSACTSTACTTPLSGYYLTSVAAATPAPCATGCTACTSSTVCTTAASGYYLSSSVPVACTTGCTTCTASTASACSACSTGYYITLSYGAAPTSSSNSGSFSSSVLNSTAVKVLSGSNSTDSAKWDSSSTTTVVAGVLASYTYFGPGLVNTTSYLYGIPTSGVSSATSTGYISTSSSYSSGTTATIYTVSSIRKRTINATTVATGSDSTEASVTGDTTISTSFMGLPGAYAVAPGYLALLSTSYDSATAATGSVNAQVYITLVSGSAGTAATTKLTSTSDVWASSSSAPAANTACVTTTYGLGNIWYDIGSSAFFFTYWKKTITSAATNSLGSCSTTTTTAYTIYLGGIYLSGSLYWTPPISVSAYTSTAPVTSLIGGFDNWLNSSNIYITYKDTTTGTATIYYSKTTKSNSTTAIAAFSSLIKDTTSGTSGAAGYVTFTFTPNYVWASNYTYGITVANATSTYTTATAYTTTYTYTNFLNGSTTGVDSGLSSSGADYNIYYQGYQLNTGYSVLASWATGSSSPYSYSYTLATYYANGTVNKTTATLGSTQYALPQFYEDLNGTFWIGWIDVDTANYVTGYGYLTYNAYLGILQGQLNTPSYSANLLSALSAVVLLFAAIFIF